MTKPEGLDIDNPPVCKECEDPMLIMYGCGWDYDRWICGTRGCDYEIELETTTTPKDISDD